MPEKSIEEIDELADGTIVLRIESPDGFEAYPGQFILLREEIDGEEEKGYYTLSSPDMEDTFEITVEVNKGSGTIGPHLARKAAGDKVNFDGPFGETRYKGEKDVVVVSEGPGIGPAVGIGERALDESSDVRLVYYSESPIHEDRLSALEGKGAYVEIVKDRMELQEALNRIEEDREIYVFGFADFIDTTTNIFDERQIETGNIHIENFG